VRKIKTKPLHTDSTLFVFIKTNINLKPIKQMATLIAEVLMIVISIGCVITIVKHLITDK